MAEAFSYAYSLFWLVPNSSTFTFSNVAVPPEENSEIAWSSANGNARLECATFPSSINTSILVLSTRTVRRAFLLSPSKGAWLS